MAENREAPHTFTKQGVYYFCRRVPKDLQQHYKSPKISYSLRATSSTVASSRALKLEEWRRTRVKQINRVSSRSTSVRQHFPKAIAEAGREAKTQYRPFAAQLAERSLFCRSRSEETQLSRRASRSRADATRTMRCSRARP